MKYLIAVCGFVGGVVSMTATVEPHSGTADREDTVRIVKPTEREIEVAGTFAVPRGELFDAITSPKHLAHWMSAAGMSLVETHVDGRAGGSFRYVFQRPSGKKIEVRGAYSAFDAPRGFAYVETYDFSPLRIEVTTALEEAGGETRLTQTLGYASARERDEDFDGVATSSREAYAKLARYLLGR
jgi:uncharacterized protein YndB with AHSA1/START domain